jgi:hypothetical protein
MHKITNAYIWKPATEQIYSSEIYRNYLILPLWIG